MPTGKEKTHENYLRRWAVRLGWQLEKSRGRRWSIDDRLGYRLVDKNGVIKGERFELGLKDVAQALDAREKELRPLAAESPAL
jgi:hypothetical protein